MLVELAVAEQRSPTTDASPDGRSGGGSFGIPATALAIGGRCCHSRTAEPTQTPRGAGSFSESGGLRLLERAELATFRSPMSRRSSTCTRARPQRCSAARSSDDRRVPGAVPRRLLIATDATTSQVAGRLGFGSTSRFHERFVRDVGQPPAAYRRAMR